MCYCYHLLNTHLALWSAASQRKKDQRRNLGLEKEMWQGKYITCPIPKALIFWKRFNSDYG